MILPAMRNFKINSEHYQPRMINNRDSLFRNIFDESPDAIFLLDPGSFVIIDCNSQALQLFQAACKSDLAGKHTFELYDSEPVEFSRQILVSNVNEGMKHTQELAFRSVKGNVFWGCGSFQKVETAKGSLVVFRVRRVVDYMMTAEMLSLLVRQTSRVSGGNFFCTITELLTRIFGVNLSVLARVHPHSQKAEILEYWPKLKDNGIDHFDINTSPSLNVTKGYTTFYPSHLGEMFPEDDMVRNHGFESFLGTPVFNPANEVIGLLMMMDSKPMAEIPNSRFILSMFAARVSSELDRLETEERLRQQIEDLQTKINLVS